MPEIKVQCDCGQKFKFDVVPVNGRMPHTVNCPVCGMDGTERANAILQDLAAAPPPTTVSSAPAPIQLAAVLISGPAATAPIGSSAPVPAPVARATFAPTAPVGAAAPIAPAAPAAAPTSAPRLRINKATEEAPAPAASEGAPPPPPVPRPRMAGARPAAAVPAKSGRKPSFAMGFLGAVLGAVIGSAIYFVVFKNYMTSDFDVGFRLIGLVGFVVGFLAGLGARVLGKEGSNELGVITGTLTVAGILGAQYLVAQSLWRGFTHDFSDLTSYEHKVEEARKVVEAVPTGSDLEIRVYVAKEFGSKPEEVPADEIKEFRESQLPGYRDFASGKITKEQFDAEHKAEQEREKKMEKVGESAFKTLFFVLLLNKVNIFTLCAATALAYKMSTDA